MQDIKHQNWFVFRPMCVYCKEICSYELCGSLAPFINPHSELVPRLKINCFFILLKCLEYISLRLLFETPLTLTSAFTYTFDFGVGESEHTTYENMEFPCTSWYRSLSILLCLPTNTCKVKL